MISKIIYANHENLHYLDTGVQSDAAVYVLLHGLTANCHAFDGVLAAGLLPMGRLIIPDLRGRGLSDQPMKDYSMEEHAADIAGILSALKIERATFIGHSFGGFVSMYTASVMPELVEDIVLLDAAARMNEKTAEMLGNRFAVLDKVFESEQEYLEMIKASPYLTFWDDEMLSYYQADIRNAAGGGITPIPTLMNMVACSIGLGQEDWPMIIESIKQRILLLHAPEPYALGEPLLPDDNAKEMMTYLQAGTLRQVPGNHQTMLYGAGARAIVQEIKTWQKTAV